jgi:ubiquinone/menaquinone biosynthesis C-methylase UbiE
MTLHMVTQLAVSLALTLWEPAQRSSASLTTEGILQALQVGEGGTVCEIGAGDGAASISAARIVGPKGRVYTNELGGSKVSKLRDKVAASGVAQITVVEGQAAKTNFPEGGCDGVFMRDVYHHFTDPASINASILAALKPGARVAVVDFTPPQREASIPAERAQNGRHGVSAETVLREMKDAGLEPVSSELPTDRWFMIVLSKPRR